MDARHGIEGGFPPVETLIPHEGPMVLLDEVVAFGDDAIRCRRTVRAGALFVDQGRLDATVSLELMAQTIAAFAGYTRYQSGEGVKIAFLLSCRELDLRVPAYAVGDVLEITASPLWVGDRTLGSFASAVYRDGAEVASAQINVYQGPLQSIFERDA